MFARNIERQPARPISTPPRGGPSMSPMATVPPMKPRARPRPEGGAIWVTMAMPSAWLMAAPMPCKARKAMSQETDGASPQHSEARTNSTSPAAKMRFLSRMSPSRDTSSSRLAMARM